VSAAQPPAAATWLLERFTADEALVGDLIEQYWHRSPIWYWKQALSAIIVGTSEEIASHKWLTVRALTIGYTVWFVLINLLLHGFVAPWLNRWMATTESVVARVSTAGVPLVVYFAVMFGNGWVIARLHRPHQNAMVLAYVAFCVAASVAPVYNVAVDALQRTGAGSPLAWELGTRSLTIVCVLSGGLLSSLGQQHPPLSTPARQAHDTVASGAPETPPG
jgi:hypothetical protein